MSSDNYRSRQSDLTTQNNSQNESHSRRHRHKDRSRSPRHTKHSHTHRSNTTPSKPLPLNAAPISKNELVTFRPLLALYLDVQKRLDIEDIEESEVKGRWKSFVKKWNAGDLAEGWYDPVTFDKAKRGTFGLRDQDIHQHHPVRHEDAASDEDDFGPTLPADITRQSTTHATPNSNEKPGPSIPGTADLQYRDEEAREFETAARSSGLQLLRASRRSDRKLQESRLDELVPRAEAGTRERQLEKKREAAASNRTFAAAKDAGGDVELRDADVMGEEDSLGELKRMKENEKRKRTDREVKREEILRARMAEREERVKGMREKEAKTMEMLKGIARARFGGSETGYDDNGR